MSLEEILEEAKSLAEEAMKVNPKKISDDFDFPDKRGVYLIYKKNQVIYIGQGKHLRKRLKQHLSANQDANTSTLRRSLNKKCGIALSETRQWIMDNCRISLYKIEDSDLCTLVESLLIAHCRTLNKVLLNS